MRVPVVVCLALGLVLAGTPVAAQEAKALRRELEQHQTTSSLLDLPTVATVAGVFRLTLLAWFGAARLHHQRGSFA